VLAAGADEACRPTEPGERGLLPPPGCMVSVKNPDSTSASCAELRLRQAATGGRLLNLRRPGPGCDQHQPITALVAAAGERAAAVHLPGVAAGPARPWLAGWEQSVGMALLITLCAKAAAARIRDGSQRLNGEPGAAGQSHQLRTIQDCGAWQQPGAAGGRPDRTVLGQMHELGGPAAGVKTRLTAPRISRSRESCPGAGQSP